MATRKSRRWRWPLFALGGLLGLLLFVSLLLQTSFFREQVRKQANAALSPLFQGKIQIERLGRLGLWGVGGVDARIFDSAGRQVLRVQGLEARADLPQLGYQLAFGGTSPRLHIDRVRIDYVDVTLREDEDLGVTLASAFLPFETEPPQPEADDAGELELWIDDIELRRVWAHGRVSGSPALDADVLELRAELSQTASGFALELEHAELSTRGLPGAAEPGGTIWGSIDVPAGEGLPLRLEGYLDGRAANSPLWLETTWTGDDLYAQVRLPELPASYVNQRVGGLELQGQLALRAEVEGTLPELEVAADLRGSAGHVALNGTAFLADGLEAAVSLAASGVNLAQLQHGAPESDLRARVDALLLEGDEGSLAIAHRVEIDDGRLAGVDTPRANVNGRLELPATGGVNARGSWQVAELGADLHGQYSAALHDRAADLLTVSLQGKLESPARLAALGVTTRGSLNGRGELRPQTRQLDAKLELNLSQLDYRMFQARSVQVQAQASGDLQNPRMHAATTLELLSGRVHADVHYSEQAQEVSLFLADIDMHRLTRLFGVELPFEQGNLNLDARARREGNGRQPFVVDGNLRADFGAVGALSMTARNLEIPSELRGPQQLTKLNGELVAKGRLDLSRANRLSSMIGLPLERTTGIVRFELSGRQTEGDPRGPELSLLVDTNGLRIVERRVFDGDITTTAEAIANKPFALEGIDAHASLRFLPSSGEAVATVIARDRGGTLLTLEGEAQLGDSWLTTVGDPQTLLNAPLKLHAEIPERRIQGLPPLVRPGGLAGRVALDAELAGSLADPRVRAWVTLGRLRTQRGDEAVDVRANIRYSPEAGELLATATDRRGVDLGRLSTRWQGDLRRALQQPLTRPALVGSVDAELFGLPLEVVPILAEQQLKGRVTGKASLRDWGKDARLEARFEGRNLIVGTASLPSIHVLAHNRADKLLVEVGVATGKGALRGSLEADAAWGAQALPKLERRGLAKLSAKRFELGTLTPLVGAYVSELGGLLDADAQVAVDGAATRVSGTAKLEHGVIQFPAIGQRFIDISAKVAVGDNQFKLQELHARGLTGRVSVTGAARLDGFALRSANAHAIVKKQEPLPVTIEGAVLGDAWGNVKVTYLSPATGERKLDIEVPEFHLTTPETEGHGLQSLDNLEEIRIGTRREDGTFVPLPVQPLEPGDDETVAGVPAQPLRVNIRLGPNVTVARGGTAQAQLTGQLLAVSNGETTLTGRIEVKGGRLDVQGKTFEIERGVVTFDGRDPANPSITATARWDAPEHAVYAEYVGDVEDGRIKLRSEPPLTQDEIASLLLFGDPNGSVGGGDPNTAALAVSVAGDTAAKGLNQALSDFTKLDVRARVDTTTGSARPELALQVSPRVVARVTRAIGEPGVGESPDRTFLTLELRLRRAWALSAVFGDHGASALDLIWRHRY